MISGAPLAPGPPAQGHTPAGSTRDAGWPGARLRQRMFRQRPEDALPLSIRHQRIYILPTQRGWAFLGVLMIMLLASVNYALSLGYALCFLLTGLFSACLLYTYRNLAGLGVEGVRVDPVFAGQPLVFRIALSNPDTRPRPGLQLRTATGRTRLPMPAADSNAGSAIATLGVTTGVRGLQALGRMTLSSDYPLGLWRSWSYVHAAAVGIVYPAPEAGAPPLPPGRQPAIDAGRTRRDNQGDIAGLRAYQPGDALSSIAWKSAARGQGLQVREREQPHQGGEPELSLTTAGLSPVEEALSRLTAWVLRAETAGLAWGFYLGDTQLAPGHGSDQRDSALRALAVYGLSEDSVASLAPASTGPVSGSESGPGPGSGSGSGSP